jgi:hypothetical protein
MGSVVDAHESCANARGRPTGNLPAIPCLDVLAILALPASSEQVVAL